MKKKTKKIPKFANGGTWDKVYTGIEAGVGILGQTFGKPATFGGVVSGIGQGAAAGLSVGGPMGALIGGAAGGLLAGIGTGASVDDTGYNMQRASGLSKLFGIGKSNSEMYAEAYRKQNSTQNKRLTQQMQYEFMSDPRNTLNTNVFANAAEGGVMRQSANALVSPGEIAIDPYTLKYEQFGTDNEEPNSKDNIPVILEEGEIVKSHAKHMIMPNGKTPAENSKMVLDSNMPEETKRKMIKKIDNWESAHRTKPQQYAKFDEGNSGTRNVKSADDLNWYKDIYQNKAITDWFASTLGMINANNFEEYNKLQNAYASLGFGDTKPGNIIHKNDAVANYQGLFDNMTDINGLINNLYSTGRLKGRGGSADVAEVWRDGLPGSATWLRHLGRNVDAKTLSEMNADLHTRGIEAFINPSNGMVNYRQMKPATIDKDKLDAAMKGMMKAPTTFGKPLSVPKLSGDEKSEKGKSDNGKNGSNWRDGLYRMAVLSQPLWDRAKAEPVNYESPVYKYMPTAIDVATQLADTDQSYALARYNFANLYPNSGAGMAAGLQAATDRSKQRAAIRQYQTNAQNDLIGKNAGIYNNWSNEHARIMNSVYDKYAANRASARNINRQNTAIMLNNFGQMLRDDKQNVIDRMKFAALKPAIQSTYEDSSANDIYKWYKELFE